MVPNEVFIMLKLAGGPDPETTSAPVALLEWYDRRDEVIIVMERPTLAVDLLDFILENGGALEEELAKVLKLVEPKVSCYSFDYRFLIFTKGSSKSHSV